MAGQSEHRGPAEGEAYGIAGLTQQLRGIDFPISKEELVKRYGDKTFRWTKNGETLRLRDYLQGVGQQEFQAITQITHAVSDEIHAKSR